MNIQTSLGCWFLLISPYIAQFMGRVVGGIHYGLKVVFCFRPFTAFHYRHDTILLTSIEHLYNLPCGCVYNMLLVLSITFHFYQNIWGCMCSTHFSLCDWKYISIAHAIIIKSEVSYRLLSYFPVAVCLRYLSHHILSLIAYTFQENRDVVSLLLCSLWWVQIVRCVWACRSYSFVCIKHHLIIIIVQTDLKTLNL